VEIRKPLDPTGGPEWRSRYSDSLRAERSVDQIAVGARFSAPVLIGLGAHPPFCKMYTGSLPGVQRQGVALTTHPHLAPRLKEE